MNLINQTLVNDAFLHLSALLPQDLSEYDQGYLQGLKDYQRHLVAVLKEGGVQPH